MDRPRLLIRMAYICSECETAIKLRVADKVPKVCPHCGVTFDNSNNGNIQNIEESIVSLKTPVSSNG